MSNNINNINNLGNVEFINLTPHAIKLTNMMGTETFQPSGLVARIEQSQTIIGDYNMFEIVAHKATGHNLPEPQTGKFYIVSAMVLSLAKELGRTDCVAPDTNRANRNDQGHIISVPGFVC